MFEDFTSAKDESASELLGEMRFAWLLHERHPPENIRRDHAELQESVISIERLTRHVL